ncbi:helix-turn-helix domain-containing protein [Nostoc favosum]|uniref:Helix-turn-helix domain-containing protein n=1 Tax=Nostoc favosum CHAB5714 TaxID=2780399 RepID=A0ABS8I8M8_9NOSO|nr:helix-turn-helix domain-containing protein [Nostoc favosum]MCC5600534.1 helix-turn-helix domain-containing protein [Nostoc favosum CHAB5714]
MSLTEKIQSDGSSYGRRKRHIYIDSKLDDLPLTMEAFRVYSHLCRRAGCDNNAFPSYKSIGEACFRGSFPGSSTETLRQKAIAAVSELVSWNLITKTSITKSNGSVSSNQYQLTDIDDWFVFPTKQSSLIRGKNSGSSGGILGVVLGGNQGSNEGIPGVVIGEDQGSSGGIPKVYPIKDYPIEVYPLKDAPLATPPARPTQECVCEKEELDLTTEEIELEEPTPEKPSLKEPTPELPALLSKNSESLQQTDNPSRRSTIAAGSFEKSEQANKPQLTCPYKTARNVKELIDAWLTDPTAMSDDFVPLVVREKIKWNRWVLPWHSGERKLNNLYQNFNPIVVDFLAQELATKSKRSAQLEITHAIAVMNTWEKTKGGWTNLMQRYQQALQTEKQSLPQQHTALAHRANNITSTTLEDALAQDHKRRQQEQSKQVPSNEYQHSPQMLELKAKLQAKANEPKVASNSRLSSMNLREVEAQFKLALQA